MPSKECMYCGSINWKLLYHADTTYGGGWAYLCDECKRVVVYEDYSDLGFDDSGNPISEFKEEPDG